jgi:hypothetical protein
MKNVNNVGQDKNKTEDKVNEAKAAGGNLAHQFTSKTTTNRKAIEKEERPMEPFDK